MSINPGMNSSAIYVLPGMTVKIKALKHFCRHDDVTHEYLNGESKPNVQLRRGFVVDNPDIGDIEDSKEEEASILYKHKKFAENVITFYADTGEMGKVFVISVPIHDHSSIITGGPAYGTYFTDDELHEKKPEGSTQ
jgi:hypothetical protein